MTLIAIDRRDDIRAAQVVGEDAKPTGRMRQLSTGTAARLQQEWRGGFGVVWLDVPIVRVDEMPERNSMSELSDIKKHALQYVEAAGGLPKVVWFDEDHEPIGPGLRRELKAAGLISVFKDRDGVDCIILTADGKAAIS